MTWNRPLSKIAFVALDLEATGVAHGHDRIVEIGAARFTVDAAGRVCPGPVFETLVDPQMAIPEIVSRVTGIDDGMVAGSPVLADVWQGFIAFVDGDRGELAANTVVLAHSARSDLSYLMSEALRLCLPLPTAGFACTLGLSRAAFPDAPRHTLGALVEHLGIAREGATYHRALADALHTRNLFAQCVAKVGGGALVEMGSRGPESWPEPADFVVDIPERLQPLLDGIRSRERVEIIYKGGSKGRVKRPLTPLAFFAHQGVPYLRGWCHLDDSAKSFRCDRILRVVSR